MLVDKWHRKLEEVLLDGARWRRIAQHALLELAISQRWQNALQLADDMYVEVISLSVFLSNSNTQILVLKTSLCYHKLSCWCRFCAENVAQPNEFLLLNVKPQLRSRQLETKRLRSLLSYSLNVSFN